VGRLTADEFVERVRERVLATRASVPVANEDSERGHCWRVGVAHGARVAYEMLRLIDQPLTGLRATGFAHGHQWNAHAICVLCREQAKDLLDADGMYRPCTSRRLRAAQPPQRTGSYSEGYVAGHAAALAELAAQALDARERIDAMLAWRDRHGESLTVAVRECGIRADDLRAALAAAPEGMERVLLERVRVLSAFARTAPGRLPQEVQDALSEWENPDAVLTPPSPAVQQEGGE
jgi:hypothetical protein